MKKNKKKKLKNIKKKRKIPLKAKKKIKKNKKIVNSKKKKVQKKNLVFFDFYIDLLRDSHKRFLMTTADEKKELAKKKKRLKVLIGSELTQELIEIKKEIAQILENNEFLRFEVFSGSGENLRSLAGRKPSTIERITSNVKPQSKSLLWAFEGEIWLDEIGHYKSSLKNNCAQKTAQKR